jgi:hypothetical protein
MECLVIRYRMTRRKTDSPVLFQNCLFLAIVELAFQCDGHSRGPFLSVVGSAFREVDSWCEGHKSCTGFSRKSVRLVPPRNRSHIGIIHWRRQLSIIATRHWRIKYESAATPNGQGAQTSVGDCGGILGGASLEFGRKSFRWAPRQPENRCHDRGYGSVDGADHAKD